MFLTAGLCFCAWTDQKWSRVSNEALMLLAFVGVMEWGMGFITGALSGVCGGSDSLVWRRNASAICRSMSGQ